MVEIRFGFSEILLFIYVRLSLIRNVSAIHVSKSTMYSSLGFNCLQNLITSRGFIINTSSQISELMALADRGFDKYIVVRAPMAVKLFDLFLDKMAMKNANHGCFPGLQR